MAIAARVVGDARHAAIVAGLDMAAERCRSTGHNGAHDAPLGAAEASFVRPAIGIPVAAENIRHLQVRGHVTRRSGGRHDFQCQPIERALRLPDKPVRDPRVARRARQVGMAQQHLNDADIGAALQQMRGEAMPQRMHRDPLG
jgi:hypothetical protein